MFPYQKKDRGSHQNKYICFELRKVIFIFGMQILGGVFFPSALTPLSFPPSVFLAVPTVC